MSDRLASWLQTMPSGCQLLYMDWGDSESETWRGAPIAAVLQHDDFGVVGVGTLRTHHTAVIGLPWHSVPATQQGWYRGRAPRGVFIPSPWDRMNSSTIFRADGAILAYADGFGDWKNLGQAVTWLQSAAGYANGEFNPTPPARVGLDVLIAALAVHRG